jgi:hypothetical protein
MPTITDVEIKAIVDTKMHEIFAAIQNKLGQDDGGNARFFHNRIQDDLVDYFVEYALYEVNIMNEGRAFPSAAEVGRRTGILFPARLILLDD